MSYMDYSTPHTIQESGQRAFLRGIDINDNPVDGRTDANGKAHWENGWIKQSKIECKGIRLGDGYSGCTQTGGDCPACGK